MQLRPFRVERYYARYEFTIRYMLARSTGARVSQWRLPQALSLLGSTFAAPAAV